MQSFVTSVSCIYQVYFNTFTKCLCTYINKVMQIPQLYFFSVLLVTKTVFVFF